MISQNCPWKRAKKGFFEISEYARVTLEWQVSRFLKGQIPRFIFHCFLGFYATQPNNAMSEGAEISRVGLPIHVQWHINYEDFVKFEEQFNKSEKFNDEFYFEISKTTIFLDILSVCKKGVFHDFPCFLFCTQFLWFFCVFHITENLPLYVTPLYTGWHHQD